MHTHAWAHLVCPAIPNIWSNQAQHARSLYQLQIMQPKGSLLNSSKCPGRNQNTHSQCPATFFFTCASETSGAVAMWWCPHSNLCWKPSQQPPGPAPLHGGYVRKVTIWQPSSSSNAPSKSKLGQWQLSKNPVAKCIPVFPLKNQNHFQVLVAACEAHNLPLYKCFHISA